jgi:RNA polymerase sigma-70 factor (ECF subfamily)
MSKPKKKKKQMDAETRKQYAECYAAHRKKIFLYIYRKVNKKELAEDLASDVFVKLAENTDVIEDRNENGVQAWLYTVARNKTVDHFRKQGRSKQKVEIEEQEVFEIISSTEPDYLKGEIKDEKIEMLQGLIEGLKPETQEIFTLRFQQEMQYNEIAEVLDKNEGAVKMAVYRALDDIKEKLNKHLSEEKEEIYEEEAAETVEKEESVKDRAE